MNFINLAFYKFVDFAPELLPEIKAALLEASTRLELKGTILLSGEGLNCFVAGTRAGIDEIKALVEQLPGMPQPPALPYKESLSEHQPFTRMLVKIKKEIITMGRPDVRPARSTGPRVSPREFKQWLDEGRELVVLDTRNDYEVRLGTFENAVTLDLKTFRQFPGAVKILSQEQKKKTVVSFCTGGIRCEKASALLLEEGFESVYQLDGGILKYFEEVGASHFKGECFVFDDRVAVDPTLKETQTVLCYNCQNPVTASEQARPEYVRQRSCPHCLGKPTAHKEQIAAGLQRASLSNF